MLEVTGKRVVLREFTQTHLNEPRYLAWLRDLEIVLGIHRLEYLLPLDEARIREYANKLMESENDYFFALHLSETDQFVGTAKLGHVDWRSGLADAGIMIGEKSAWGKGLATDAISSLCRYGFHTLSLRKLTGGTSANNYGMVRCFEKVGFKREGVLRKNLLEGGAYVDHLLFGLFADELI